jgi:anthranilate phosphoribosyltransferase
VHADDGLDELSISAPTYVAELRDGKVETYTVTPEQFGFKRAEIKSISVASAAESLSMIEGALTDKPGSARDIVALNAGAALYAAGIATTFESGVNKALATLSGGGALDKLRALAGLSQTLAKA